MEGNVFTPKILEVMLPDGFDAAETNRDHGARDTDYVCIVMEYVKSDLKKVLNSTNQIQFKEDHVVVIVYNVLCALHFFHTAGLMHRDIKPANILIDEKCQVKLCDFGLSRTLPEADEAVVIDNAFQVRKQRVLQGMAGFKKAAAPGSPKKSTKHLVQDVELTPEVVAEKIVRDPLKHKQHLEARRKYIGDQLLSLRQSGQNGQRPLSGHVVSRWYRPPEIILNEGRYDQAIDVWSLGCVIGELLYCTEPN